jgi:tRNA(Ile)-lysidine synthase
MTAPLEAGLEACARRLDPASRAPIAVAFSGGGDSLALLLLARTWARRAGRDVVALHVDHGLQAPSGAWAEQARAQAGRLGAAFRLLCWDGAKPGSGLPAAARAARHRLIGETARAEGCSVVLLGHTLDDQLENALMRGAGTPVGALREWSPSPAWPEGRGLFYARPLLTARRAALRAWLRAEGLDWLDDPANDDPRHARARARRQVEDGDEPAVQPPTDVAALADACRPTAWGGFEIDRRRLTAAGEDTALRLLQLALACASGTPAMARPGRARDLLARLAAPDGFTAVLAGARVEAGPEVVRLAREAGEAARGGLAPVRLEPGRATVWDGRFEACAPEADWQVRALRGIAGRLEEADAAAARAFPASVRPSLAVLCHADGEMGSVRLALARNGDHIGTIGWTLRPLASERFAGAAGLVTKEIQIGAIARMAVVPPPSYVEAEGKG